MPQKPDGTQGTDAHAPLRKFPESRVRRERNDTPGSRVARQAPEGGGWWKRGGGRVERGPSRARADSQAPFSPRTACALAHRVRGRWPCEAAPHVGPPDLRTAPSPLGTREREHVSRAPQLSIIHMPPAQRPLSSPSFIVLDHLTDPALSPAGPGDELPRSTSEILAPARRNRSAERCGGSRVGPASREGKEEGEGGRGAFTCRPATNRRT